MSRKYQLFSADSHLEISPERWTKRIPVKYRDRAPRLVKLANGGDGIHFYTLNRSKATVEVCKRLKPNHAA